MLSVQENERLSRVGKGTPMGELMRRYWHPIAAVLELDEKPTKAVKVLGEELVLYKDNSGKYGLVDRYCPHRRVDLSYGIPEEHGLRCMYHGWMFDESGACIEQPFEETVHPDGRFKEKTGIAGYPVKALAGLLFAYLGPQPAPELPLWEPLTWEHAVRDICITNLPCNWLQCQENSLDPVHVEWMHTYFGRYIEQGAGFKSGKGLLTLPTHQKIGFDVFEYGIIKRRVLSGFTEEDDDWAHGHPVMFPNILMVGSEAMVTFQFRVPVDDENTYHVSLYSWRAAPGAEAPKQESVPYRNVRLYNDDGSLVTDYLFNQDYMGWVTQGPIAERDREMLGESDKGIILFRKQLADQLEILADGGEPMNVFHTPGEVLKAPIEGVKFGLKRALDYRPGEAGYSRDGELITQTLQTWRSMADAGRGPTSPS